MVVLRIILSTALLCVLPLPFSSLITESAPALLVLDAPPLRLLSPSPSSRSINKESGSGALEGFLNNLPKYNPPAPPSNMAEFKKCFGECRNEADKMYPDCKKSIPSGRPGEDPGFNMHMLCPLTSLYCYHVCRLEDCDWDEWMYSLGLDFPSSQNTKARH
ncbi:hypothetical protein BGX29_008612 [Mortierella sp. GBA35]|nr:hypothetical protein BGX29_008612 [Mortierella sp. GBA35]